MAGRIVLTRITIVGVLIVVLMALVATIATICCCIVVVRIKNAKDVQTLGHGFLKHEAVE